MMGLSWGIGYQLSRSLLIENFNDLKGFRALFWGLFIFSWLGAKVFFLLTAPQDLAGKIIANSSFWLGGGFVFYGGLIFGLAYLFVYSLVLKQFEFKKMAYFIPGLTIGHAVGRIGCFLAGCCFGTETTSFLSVRMHEAHRHPVQLYESATLFLLGYFILRKLKQGVKPGIAVSYYLMFYSALRFSLEFIRGDKIRGIYSGLSTSQWVSIALAVMTLTYLVKEKKLS
jgi:phosphatidylglycerol:prolipoprotein diacylglycerol transferase